jgi:FkbM family methyltransferase
LIRARYPITAVLRDGTTIELQNERVIKLSWKNIISQNGVNGSEYNVKYDLLNKVAIITLLSNDEKNAKISEGINNGDLWSIFVKDEYQRLPVQDKTVIDIGANIGDSPIYFALRGAKKVIALEPCLESYSIAISNLKTNDLLDKITFILAGLSSSPGIINLNYTHDFDGDEHLAGMHFSKDNTQFSLVHREKYVSENHFDGDEHLAGMHFNKDNRAIPLLTIKDILDKFEIYKEAVLKMDCEGCEYESILSASFATLQRFSNILIEYHYGYKDLREKLKSSGFNVSVSNPIYKRKGKSSRSFYVGYLHATRARN